MKTHINYEEAYKDLGLLGFEESDLTIVSEPDPEDKPAPEPEAPSEPEAPVEDAPVFATQESIKELENKFELYARQIAESVNRVQAPAQPAPQAPPQALTQKPLETFIYDEEGNAHPDPLAAEVRKLQERLEAQDKAMSLLHERAKQAGEVQVNTQLGAALHEMRTKFPDFDSLVRIEEIEHARRGAIEAGAYTADWRGALYNRYQQVLFPKLLQERDELAKKRDEKREQATQATSVVPAGGSTYQAPRQPQLTTGKRGYADARAAMMAEFDALQAGG